MKLIVAEKPSIGRELAGIVGAKEKKDGKKQVTFEFSNDVKNENKSYTGGETE